MAYVAWRFDALCGTRIDEIGWQPPRESGREVKSRFLGMKLGMNDFFRMVEINLINNL